MQKPAAKASTLALFTEPANISFDNIKGEHNYKSYTFFNIFSYICLLISIFLQFAFLASDVFTLIQIYALKNWDADHTITYIPILAYKIVFTTCIGISFLYVIFVYLFGIIIQRRNKIVSSFLHTGARQIDSLISFEKFCVYQEIQGKTFSEWLSLSIYSAYHYEIISWLLADTPRQMLNAATIAYVVSNKFTSGDIGGIISQIAKSDKRQAVLISFMFFSFVIWLFFTVKNALVIISSVCVIPRTRSRGKAFNVYCADLVAKNVSDMYTAKAEVQEVELAKRRKVPSLAFGEVPLPTAMESFSLSSFDKSEKLPDPDLAFWKSSANLMEGKEIDNYVYMPAKVYDEHQQYDGQTNSPYLSSSHQLDDEIEEQVDDIVADQTDEQTNHSSYEQPHNQPHKQPYDQLDDQMDDQMFVGTYDAPESYDTTFNSNDSLDDPFSEEITPPLQHSTGLYNPRGLAYQPRTML